MKKVYLIAGHHSNDPGAVSRHPELGGTITEAELTQELRDLVFHYFVAHNKLVPIKDNDQHTLQQVLNEINRNITKDDVLVDIHFNAFNGSATGVEVLIPTINSNVERSLATTICERLSDIMKIRNRGLRTEAQTPRGRIAILHGVGHRVLIEVCFKDNPSDMRAYWKNKHLVAEAIAYEVEKALK